MLFSQRRPAGHVRGRFGSEADRQLVPDPLVGPVLDLVGQRHVDVIAAARRAAHAGKREAAFVVGVDQFVIARRHIGQDAEPAERIFALDIPCPRDAGIALRLGP